MKQICFFTILSINPITTHSQNFTGAISDVETQKPLVCVTVKLKGKTTGTVTNSKGQFFLKNEKIPSTLWISMVSSKHQKVIVTDNNTL